MDQSGAFMFSRLVQQRTLSFSLGMFVLCTTNAYSVNASFFGSERLVLVVLNCWSGRLVT